MAIQSWVGALITCCLGALVIAPALPCRAQSAVEDIASFGETPTADLTSRPLLTTRIAATDRGGPSTLPSAGLRAAVPHLAYAYTAYGARTKAVGVQGYGAMLVAAGQGSVLGGGAMVWGSPLSRLTLIGDAQRNTWGNFSPSFGAVAHILGRPYAGWSLGCLGMLKVEGFAGGPNKDEIETELEIGTLVSLNEAAWHLDMNAIGGRGLGDDGEMDVEGRVRLGRDWGRLVRLGVDGQFRARAAGPRYLPNGRTYDFSVGPQLFVGNSGFYGSFTVGPSTTGLTTGAIGFTSVLAVGGTT